MLRRTFLSLSAFACVLSAAACSGPDGPPDAAPSATLGSQSSSTTAAETATTTELTVEQEVEAAYLRSWDVYSEAVRTFDTTRLADVYVGEALELRIREIERLRAANTPARVDVDHDIEIAIADAETALVRDDYFNRSVLLDGETGEPIEETPNEVVRREYHLRLVGETWKVAFATER